ncbi:MAG TPA: Crp/Fnr family transcriptional regulator [Candidatus Acidoferrales bacterium]|nr:Crp/Fnr family transcriptional regulator [Candidatus Acidoferrales bacterium]
MDVLLTNKCQTLLPGVAGSGLQINPTVPRIRRLRSNPERRRPAEDVAADLRAHHSAALPDDTESTATEKDRVDPLYLFGCYLAWERDEDPSAGWELVAAAQSPDSNTRSQAQALLGGSCHLSAIGSHISPEPAPKKKHPVSAEPATGTSYGLEIIDACAACDCRDGTYFCRFSEPALDAWDQVSRKSTLPAGAILFVQGQVSRGVFILCSGRVNLSTTSREGKILLLKTANAGDPLGLSATVAGVGYEATAETATPCQLCFVERIHFLDLMESHSQIGVHTAQCLSRDFRSAHRDIHDLILTRSSTGKLARLLLSQKPLEEDEFETKIHTTMTHEEMAHRIGASRETVTRLLTDLRRKRLIRLDGPMLVIRDRSGLEALTF